MKRDYNQLSFTDSQFSNRKKKSKIIVKLQEIGNFVNWNRILKEVEVIDKSGSSRGGRPRKPLEWMVKMLFIQNLYNLSDPELEEQMIDRLSFQEFVGINFNNEIPDFTTLWRFKESLIEHKILDKIFELILEQLDGEGLILKRGTIVDATIIKSKNRPMRNTKREELEKLKTEGKKVSSQLDTDAKSTEKNGKKYYGYKGHIGVDDGSKIIRRRTFTSAGVHDSQPEDELYSGDELYKFGDKANSNTEKKKKARSSGIFYGILDKAKRNHPLSNRQKKRNKQYSKVRAKVEHPLAFIKSKLKYRIAMATNLARNKLKFDMCVILYNINRGIFLMKQKAKSQCYA